MPIFDYRCDPCELTMERIAGAFEPAPKCPGCGAPMVKTFSNARPAVDLGRGYSASNGYAATSAQRGKWDRPRPGVTRVRSLH